MEPFDKNVFELMDRYDVYLMEKMASLCLNNGIQSAQDDDDRSGGGNDDKADINSEEKENMKDLQQYQQYQENLQHQQSLASSDIRIIEPDKVPDTDPITDAVECPKCSNRQAFWWIVQTDSADEPSTQFFRCTKCNHTWRNPKSS